MSCGHFKVGDKGQRYEVHYIHADSGEDKVFGWSNEPHKLRQAAALMPSAKETYSLDRETKHKWLERSKAMGPIVFCLTCGIVMRRDEKNKPCKGPTKMRKMEVGVL